MIEGGYILKARKALESDLMDKPPLWSKLWDWMLLRAEWREGRKLERGQFLTSIAEMQEAMSYMVGYRKKVPSKDKIRSAYEGFAKATMITTTKTTRGMVITVLNYVEYQDPKNYEAHNETHNEDPTKPTVTPQDSKEGKKLRRKKEEKNKTFSASGDAAEVQTPASDDTPFYLTRKKRKLTGKRLESFERFWSDFDYKRGKAEAADAWHDIPELTNTLVDQICFAASQEAARRPQVLASGKTPKMAQGWVAGRRWEDDLAEPGPNTGNAQTDQNMLVAQKWAAGEAV